MNKLVRYRIFILSFLVLYQAQTNAQLTYATLRVVYDTPWVYKNLKLIPVRFKPEGAAAAAPVTSPSIIEKDQHLISLDEAMQKRMVKVKELKNRGSDISVLEVTNTSKQPVLVNSGEMLSGGKQDRMVGETKILMPGKEKHFLKVFCIEKGRWDNKAKSFKHRGRANAELRKTMDVSNRQARIWKDIDNASALEKKKSETSALLQVFNDSARIDTGYVNFFMRKYKLSDSLFAGFIAISGNQILSAELYPTAQLLQASYRQILNGFIFSAITKGGTPVMNNAKVRQFNDKFLMSEPLQKVYLSKHGKIHLQNKQIIHLTAYDE